MMQRMRDLWMLRPERDLTIQSFSLGLRKPFGGGGRKSLRARGDGKHQQIKVFYLVLWDKEPPIPVLFCFVLFSNERQNECGCGSVMRWRGNGRGKGRGNQNQNMRKKIYFQWKKNNNKTTTKSKIALGSKDENLQAQQGRRLSYFPLSSSNTCSERASRKISSLSLTGCSSPKQLRSTRLLWSQPPTMSTLIGLKLSPPKGRELSTRIEDQRLQFRRPFVKSKLPPAWFHRHPGSLR